MCVRILVELSLSLDGNLDLAGRHFLQDFRISLFVSEPDQPEKNPLALKRMNLQGEAAVLRADRPEYAQVKERYLARFPQSAAMFGFADFDLWELRMQEAHLVLGFGHAYLAEANAPGQWTHQKPEQRPGAQS